MSGPQGWAEHGRPIQCQDERPSRIGDDEVIEEGDKMHRQWHTSYGAK
jgi:hypothetical protein